MQNLAESFRARPADSQADRHRSGYEPEHRIIFWK